MRKYFYTENGNRFGPITYDQLKNVSIRPDTLVWFHGLDDWTPARELEEMKPILELLPPPLEELNTTDLTHDIGNIESGLSHNFRVEEDNADSDFNVSKKNNDLDEITEELLEDGETSTPQDKLSLGLSIYQAFSNKSYPMFKEPLSFNGRIGRIEYAITFALYIILLVTISAMSEISGSLQFLNAVNAWFLIAQGAKRCHDIGHSGWIQVIPGAPLIILFIPGQIGINKYGLNPRDNR